MKNYLRRLGLPRYAEPPVVEAALERALSGAQDNRSLKDAKAVLSDPLTRTYYERTHLQYDAISTALACLDSPEAQNTHRWKERLAPFAPEDFESLT